MGKDRVRDSTYMQARGIIDRLPHLELDSIMAEDGVPLIEECENLLCDSRTLAIWGATAFCITLVSMCLCWNCYIHWKADKATDVPAFLQNIREQQAKYKQMNLKACFLLSYILFTHTISVAWMQLVNNRAIATDMAKTTLCMSHVYGTEMPCDQLPCTTQLHSSNALQRNRDVGVGCTCKARLHARA